MCNLYSITRSKDAMRRLFEAADDRIGNLPSMPAVFPDMLAPVVRVADGVRRLEPMRWGMPDRRSSAVRPSPTSATRRARTGAGGSGRRAGASSP